MTYKAFLQKVQEEWFNYREFISDEGEERKMDSFWDWLTKAIKMEEILWRRREEARKKKE